MALRYLNDEGLYAPELMTPTATATNAAKRNVYFGSHFLAE